ncbi:MAG TPA: histone H1 [Armatimonadetes bacterium]|nr:histone H1 [Armatimonadota bacterium]HCM74020.1 histone H1 [Armatimonadota bacterium]
MPHRLPVSGNSTSNRPIDECILDDAPPQKNPAAVSLGRLGGLKGGKARAAKLTSDERTAIARKAALARWRSN